MGDVYSDFQEATDRIKLQILDQIPTPIIAMDKSMRITYINEAGSGFLKNGTEQYLGEKCSTVFHTAHCGTEECRMRLAMETGVAQTARNELSDGEEKKTVEYYTVPLKDEQDQIVGGLEFVVDITERVLYEERLREQSHTIREMSTPTIKLWEGVLVLPIVGVVDSMRAQHMMDTMLNKIVETYSKVIIMDIHGVAAVDTAVANHLIRITKATRLMGCECILSGISPAVAQTIIQLGIDMESIKTKSTLSDALLEAFFILKLEVKSVE